MEYICKDYVKIIVLKVNPFYSEVVDERNFGVKDKADILNFKNRYADADYVTVDIAM